MKYDDELWATLFLTCKKMPKNRIMLCFKPHRDIVNAMADQRLRLWRAAGSPFPLLRESQLHVSVSSLGDHYKFPERFCQQIVALLDAISFSNFQIGFDRFARFGANSAVLRGAVPNVQASALSHHICALVQSRLFPPFRYRCSFDPHMTIFYGGKPFIQKAVGRVRVGGR